MTQRAKSMLLRCMVIVLGVWMAGFGCACYIMANLGSDPVTAFIQGIAKTFGITPGMATNGFNLAAFALLLLVNRKLIHIGTGLYTLLLGLFVDLSGKWLALLGTAPGLATRVVVLAAGTLTIGAGLGIYQSAELGIGPSDGINQTIVQKSGWPYRWERIAFDNVMVLCGWLLGGVIGWGTIVGVLAVGPIMAPTIGWGARLLGRVAPMQSPV